MPRECVGPYELRRRLGAGGMGEVWEAWDERLRRRVAIKRLHVDLSSTDLRARILREARAAASLVHPSIVQIFDIIDDGKDAAIVMELVEGFTLSERLRRDGPWPESRLVALASSLAQSLEVAHGGGLLHSDLKAENVLVSDDDSAHLLDFGIATAMGSTSTAAGTPGAMSPEQARRQTLDARSDLFSLGALLYHAATGERPFRGEDAAAVGREVCGYAPPVLMDLGVVSQGLSKLVHDLLEKDPAHRPADAAVVIARLRSLASVDVAPEARLEEQVTLPSVAAPPRDRGGKWPARLAVGFLLLALPPALWLIVNLLQREPERQVLRLAVPAPSLAGNPGLALAPAAVQAAIVDELARRPELRVVPLSELAALDLPPGALGKAVAADEVLASHLTCEPRLCNVAIERVVDGRVVEVSRIEAPADNLRILASAVRPAIVSFYGSADETDEASLSAVDHRRYLEIWDAFWNRRRGGEDLLRDLKAIVARSPAFAPAAQLAAQLALQRFQDTRAEADREQALAMIRLAARTGTDTMTPLLLEGELALLAGRIDRAEEIVRRLELEAPGATASLRLRAKLVERAARPQEALAHLRTVVQRQPSVSHRLLLARVAYRHGEIIEARRELGQVLAMAPGLGQAESLLAELELLAGDVETAADLYRDLAARYPRASYWGGVGLAEMLSGDPSAAVDYFERAAALAPANPAVLLNLADALQLSDAIEEAQSRYLEVARLTEGIDETRRAQLHSVRAQALLHLGRRREAVQSAAQAQRLAPGNPSVALEAALVYNLVGDRYSALAAAETAVEGGLGARWFELPWLHDLAEEPTIQDLLSEQTGDG